MVSRRFKTIYIRLTLVDTAELESTLIKLSNAENQVEDLKLQLDDALGAEEMLVQLTERNLMLSEVRQSLAFLCLWVDPDLIGDRKSRKCESPSKISRLSKSSVMSWKRTMSTPRRPCRRTSVSKL